MKNYSFAIFLALVIFFASNIAYAQLEMPRPSPMATVSQVAGFTKISMEYSSPGVKGRQIFGDLLPYGVTWRAGANAPTSISFSNTVTIGGKNVRAGTYNLFITPMENEEWVVHLNGAGKSIFNYMKDGSIDEDAVLADDVVTLKVAPESTNNLKERLAYYISPEDNKVATVTMEWENTKLTFPIDLRTNEIMNQFGNTLE